MAISSGAALSDAQVAEYHERGWVIPDWELPAELIAEMRAEYAALLKRNPDIASDIILAPHQEEGGSMGVKGSRKWLDFATHPRLMEAARQLIGDDIILWGTTLFGKPPKNGKETPWHQDGGYYPIKPLETLTMWIPLDDVTPENGPMTFIPGSHKAHELYSHSWQEGDNKTINLVCDAEHFDEAEAEPLILKAGQVSFHDVYMIHGSKANHTEHRRAAFIVRLMPATSFYDHAWGAEIGKKHPSQGYGTRPLHLVSGQDRAGNNFEIGHGAAARA
ncbi:Ectoine hydroxylase-related dioxygenase, phytanoyl-CoA dioxygenase (PhyH) family [Roseovarius nanhaiticus]|uniref:Ectoine hydroxylase-related dioxygenase, phytanoyl-CoA dioxygenase (PhyH) family n=1 Tax=Roseovarius nanhaiticus TaxID=573024 RepID=A0A1N7G2S5_9RHOB|nr:phytanoyl-CoA dioxygenase family protein [Roseovarius nanhaiticus]SEK38863.1 Ectoine hydroxylase-related dioxygenase, phytanoyl-CoA dioxygenase (PhyH) family [Roseovarius nanhaiticus]SIS06868.1 Ectoine hydroxylase-related dioxygenase, phytanoyl-CoA dioxygenase (PhyH) family [Roseovarius nanhaiticus]